MEAAASSLCHVKGLNKGSRKLLAFLWQWGAILATGCVKGRLDLDPATTCLGADPFHIAGQAFSPGR